MRVAVRLLLTLVLAVGCAGYFFADTGVTLADRGPARSVTTYAPPAAAALVRDGGTVGADNRASAQAGAQITDVSPTTMASPSPSPSPSPEPTPASSPVAPGTPGSHTVTVVHDGKTVNVPTTAPTVAALLSTIGVSVGTMDQLSPPPSSPIKDGATVRVVRVTQQLSKVDTPIPFKKVTQNSSSVDLGHKAITQAGANGISEATTAKTFQDGKLISTAVVSTTVIKAPVDEITTIGTGHSRSGSASWYDIGGMTAASPDLPFGTVVTVTNLSTGASVQVTIADRGPYAGADRIIDLSRIAFAKIADPGTGLIPVKIRW